MKFFLIHCFLILIPVFSFAQNRDSHTKMDYHFSWDGKPTLLKVDLFYTSTLDTTSFVYGLPEMGNQTNIFHVVKNVFTGTGDVIRVDSAKRQIMIYHKTAGLKTLHYEIDGALLSAAKHNNANEQFRPQIIPGSFRSLSFNLFMQVDTARYPDLTYVWDKWPQGIGYFSSASPESKPDLPALVKASQFNWVYMVMDHQL